ncbi:DUF6298 domain-containing protein [Pedobacter sp. MR2016-24]|uniref:DUF6298 domain-containing protein n=1 Tax=Pedobacter sp. MR2016-24 TaxID=2994466 RepID=UPI0022456EA3|nr:DUF6298 domain-containing protein [Pedobacter sp. MR2016-24]MCX2484386.1 DUF6298 domain-containing protein [Pedobacter sp. MR2016-24]
MSKLLVVLLFMTGSLSVFAQKSKTVEPPKPVFKDKNGRMAYTPDAQGNRVPDFSFAGYMAGERAIPMAAVKVLVPVKAGDATVRIQSAINYVSRLPIGKDGLRGAVLLSAGVHEVSGTLTIRASGVVLRGAGMTDQGTVIHATGLDRIGVIRILGKANRLDEAPVTITDQYVPVNATQITLSNITGFKTGDPINIHRPSTMEWIEDIHTGHFGGGITSLGWKAGQRDVYWDRKITAINGHVITLDAPLTTALDAKYGGATVAKYSWEGRISQSGVEHIKLVSDYHKENTKDEYHRWTAICMENVQDAWVRQVVFEHFAGSAVNVLETAKRITVEDCKSLSPVSEIGGERRHTFLTTGQQTLFQRLYAEYGYHDFAVGFCASGPNVFVQCQSYLPFSFSGTIDSWASGVLFDIVNVEGQALSFMNRGQDGQGAGWTAANSMFWQCSAARIDCYQPPTAQNWAFGNWAQFAGDGFWDQSNEQIQPRSLYYAQLKDRMGENVDARTFLLPVETEASSSPPVAVAQKLTKLAIAPAFTLAEYIDQASARNPIPGTIVAGNATTNIKSALAGVKSIDEIGADRIKQPQLAGAMSVQKGMLVRGTELVLGDRQEVPWWNGSARPYGLKNTKFHITRFVPGRAGNGLTDDLDQITTMMQEGKLNIIDHNYGLWYDRRRDDHERIRRMDGEVWAPFYELPFARSGQDQAWDGLSKYDLTKYNLWYWDRLKQFADLADQKGLVLIHQNYFQHNIIEAGAHYADFPWRTANNINNSGFPEPVPYAGDKRIFMAEQFYDISNAERRAIHRAYIRKCLENFNGNTGVIQLIGAEFTGPLHFVQFWIDTIKEWEKETGKHPIIGLSVTKDVQDAILADPERAAVIDMIDIRYWHYQANGSAYAPEGGQNLAPRQHARLLKPKKTSFEEVYRAVAEYRTQYPAKAVIYSGDNFDSFGWAIFMAGGSLSNIEGFSPAILSLAATMTPFLPEGKAAGQYGLSAEGKAYILYNASAEEIKLDLSAKPGKYHLTVLDPKNGKVLRQEKMTVKGTVAMQKTGSGDEVILIQKL